MKNSLEFKNQIQFLISLQDLYIKIYDLELEKGTLQGKLENRLKNIDIFSKKISKTSTELNILKLNEKNLQASILKNKDLLLKIDEREKSVKTQKEYISIKNEKIFVEKDLENNELELKTTIESIVNLSASYDQLKIEKEEYIKEYEVKKSEYSNKIEDLDQEIQDQRLSKKDIIDNVDPYLLSRFEFISKYKQGVAISRIIDGVCTSCNIKIASMVIFEVMKNAGFVFCSSCSRILHISYKDSEE